MAEPNDVQDMVFRTWNALKSMDIGELREISHLCSEQAALSQKKDLITLAVISYSLNKLLSKVHYRDKVEKFLEKSMQKLNNMDFEGVLYEIEQFDQQYSFFEGSLLSKARVKVASRLYSSGVSISQSAELVDVSVSDLLEYVGATKVQGEVKTMTAIERLKLARAIFR